MSCLSLYFYLSISLSLSPSFSLPFLFSYPFSLPLVPLLSFCLSPLSVFLSISISPFLSFSLFSAPSLFLSLFIISYSPSFLGVTDITASFTGLHTVFIFLSSTTSNLKSLGVTLNTDFNTGTYVQKRHHKDYGYEATSRLKVIRSCDWIVNMIRWRERAIDEQMYMESDRKRVWKFFWKIWIDVNKTQNPYICKYILNCEEEEE